MLACDSVVRLHHRVWHCVGKPSLAQCISAFFVCTIRICSPLMPCMRVRVTRQFFELIVILMITLNSHSAWTDLHIRLVDRWDFGWLTSSNAVKVKLSTFRSALSCSISTHARFLGAYRFFEMFLIISFTALIVQVELFMLRAVHWSGFPQWTMSFGSYCLSHNHLLFKVIDFSRKRFLSSRKN